MRVYDFMLLVFFSRLFFSPFIIIIKVCDFLFFFCIALDALITGARLSLFHFSTVAHGDLLAVKHIVISHLFSFVLPFIKYRNILFMWLYLCNRLNHTLPSLLPPFFSFCFVLPLVFWRTQFSLHREWREEYTYITSANTHTYTHYT